jgi:hypothetical protein
MRKFSLLILSFSSCAKSIVGVAGGATRAALTQHQVNIRSSQYYLDLLQRFKILLDYCKLQSVIHIHKIVPTIHNFKNNC